MSAMQVQGRSASSPLLKLLHRQQSSVCVPYSRNLQSGVPYYLCRDLFDFGTFGMFIPDVSP